MKKAAELKDGSWTQFKDFLAALLGLVLPWLAATTCMAQTYSVLHHFDGANGWSPHGDLTISGSTLFGTTFWGGAGHGSSGAGVVYKINTNGSGYTVLKRFTGSDGANPEARLLLADTVLCGTTYRGGISNFGTVFKMATDGSGYSVLKQFTGVDGAWPTAGLVSSGTTLYGTTRGGGISNYGTVFKINTDGSGFSVLKQFTGSDGANPPSGLILSGTTLYGTTVWDSISDGGTVFKINTDGSGFAVIKYFSGTDGAWPEAELVLLGMTLYGTTIYGGIGFHTLHNPESGYGTVFRIHTDGSAFSIIKKFTGSDGKNPYARLMVLGSKLYGTTINGGVGFPGGDGYGTVFKINSDGSGFVVLKQFAVSDGARPWVGLVASDSALYGVTWSGGSLGYGVLFRLSFAHPSIQAHPQSRTAEQGTTAEFTVRATGFPGPDFQWFFNGMNVVDGATNSVVELVNVQSSGSGSYSVVVTNPVGVVTSAPAILNVIAPVERRPVPGITVMGEPGSLLNVYCANTFSSAPNWSTLDSVSLTSTSQWYFDLSAPPPPQRFYRAWQTTMPTNPPSLGLNMIPAITLMGSLGDQFRVDGINAIGPTDAWFTLDTVTLTNTSQLYFDVTAPGQPQRLYRLVAVP